MIEEGCCRKAAMAPVLEESENESWKKDEESKGSEGEARSLVERKSEGESDVHRLSQGLEDLLGEGLTRHGHVEGEDLVDEPTILPTRGALHDVPQSLCGCASRHRASRE